MNPFTIDLTLQPTTLDLWHVCLAGSVLVLLIVWIITLLVGSWRYKKAVNRPLPAPEVRVVEKLIEVEKRVEVEKLVPAPAPEPIILKQATDDAALQLLGLLQKEARFIDFIKEDMSAYADSDIGAAARVVHQGGVKAINEHFTIQAISAQQEGDRLTLNPGFDAAEFRLTGNIVGQAPFTGTLVHKGWRVTQVKLPKLTEQHNPAIIAAAEVEL